MENELDARHNEKLSSFAAFMCLELSDFTVGFNIFSLLFQLVVTHFTSTNSYLLSDARPEKPLI